MFSIALAARTTELALRLAIPNANSIMRMRNPIRLFIGHPLDEL